MRPGSWFLSQEDNGSGPRWDVFEVGQDGTVAEAVLLELDVSYEFGQRVVEEHNAFTSARVVLEGDWETVRDALDALPAGSQIRWSTGDPIRVALAIRRDNSRLWETTGWTRSISSHSIARDNTPIEVIA